MTEAFEVYDESFEGDARYSFAGSDELAAQIRSGAPVDVFASANTSLPDELYADDLVDEPVEFARNELVLAVPAGSDIDALGDLAAAGDRPRDRRRGRAGRRLHARGARPAAGERCATRSLPPCARRSPR